MELRRTTAALRSPMYEDLRKLLYPGFLTHPVQVNGCAMALRTLSREDLFLLECRAQGTYGVEWQNWAIAASVWMIDGQVVLGQSDIQYDLYERFKVLPRAFREDLFSVFTGLMARVEKAMSRLEAFLYEDESRYLWSSEGIRMLEKPPFVGAPVLSPNGIQKTWVTYNRYEDKRNDRKYWWGLSKFMVQPHAPKGITKLNNSEKKEDEREESRRDQIMDLAYWVYRGVVVDDKTRIQTRKGLEGLRQAETEEDLQTEMANWVAGKKDFHDKAVDFVKAKIKGEVEGRRRAEQTRIETIQTAWEEDGIPEPSFIPLMGEAAEAASRRMLAPKSSKVYENQAKHNSAYDKYIKNNPDVGALVVDEHGNVQSTAPGGNNPEQLLEMLTAPEDPKAGTDPLTSQVAQRAEQLRGKS